MFIKENPPEIWNRSRLYQSKTFDSNMIFSFKRDTSNLKVKMDYNRLLLSDKAVLKLGFCQEKNELKLLDISVCSHGFSIFLAILYCGTITFWHKIQFSLEILLYALRGLDLLQLGS